MRRCLIGDILAAASVLAPGDAAQLQINSARLIAEADAAHRYAKRHGRPHAAWGNGSLMARAMAEPLVQPANFSCASYLAAFAAITKTLADFRTAAKQRGQRLAL